MQLIKKKYLLSLLVVGLCFSACQNTPEDNTVTSEKNKKNIREYSVQSVIWMQNAAEYRALCYQAFNVAKMRLDLFLTRQDTAGKNLAIITDIDETVLNNSPYQAKLIELNQQYSADTWDDWVQRKTAEAIPGAVAFMKYAKSRGVEVFYVSNRLQSQEKATIENMKKLGFPYADEAHLLLRKDESAKKSRFEDVAAGRTIILYIGDNLSDFTSKFRAPSTAKRNALADRLQDQFGEKFIVLPNPAYGDWESKGIYQGKYDWTEGQKDSLRQASLQGY